MFTRPILSTRALADVCLGCALPLALFFTIIAMPFADRAAAAFFGLAALLMGIIVGARRISLHPIAPSLWAAFGFCVWGMLMCFAIPEAQSNISEPSKLLLVVGLGLICHAGLRSKKQADLTLWISIACGVVALWFFVDLEITPISPGQLQIEEIELNQRVLSLVLISLTLSACLVKKNLEGAKIYRYGNQSAAALLMITGLSAYASQSNSALLAWMVGVGVAGVAFLAPRRSGQIAAGLLFATALLMPVVLEPGLDVLDYLRQAGLPIYQDEARVNIWTMAISLISEQPIFGWGVEAVPDDLRSYTISGENVSLIWSHPHNVFVQVRLEMGIVGSGLFALMLGLGARDLLNMQHGASLAFLTGLVAALIGVSSVGHGLWQSWWHGTLALIILQVLSFSQARPK